MEYLENSRYCNKDYRSCNENDLKERRLYEHLVNIAGTEIDIRNRQQLYIILDMIRNPNKTNAKVTQISSGSLAEGLILPDTDIDSMLISENVDVIQDERNIKNPVQRKTFLMETNNDHPGFRRLRLIGGEDKESRFVPSETLESTREGLCLSVNRFMRNLHQYLPELSVHGPSLSDDNRECDWVWVLRSKYLPYNAIPWLSRHRKQWPPNSTIDMISKNGCLLVPIGPRILPESSVLWRLSFSVAEKCLVHSFNFTQLLCYYLLKLTLKHIVDKKNHAKGLLCSYFLKTALFWVSEEVDIDTFQLSKLSICFSHCLNRLILWVNNCFCPNYFIPQNNMFQGKISPDNNEVLAMVLDNIRDGGIDGLMYNLFPHDNGAHPLSNTLNESFFINLEFLFYRVCWYHATSDDEGLYFETLKVIESLLKSRSSKFIIDVCKYLHAKISQLAVQLLPPPTRITKTFNIHKLYHRLLQDGIKADAVSGWLLYASFYYVTGKFEDTLKLTDFVLERCPPEMLLTGFEKYSDRNISNYRNHVHSTMTMNEKMRTAFVSEVRYIKRSSLIPAELLEVFDGNIFIPPDVMSHCLRFLCFHHLGEFTNCKDSLSGLEYSISRDENWCRPFSSPDSFEILRVCQECYDKALRCNGD